MGNALPTQDATRTWASGAGPDSAACRGGECKANTAVDGDRLGSFEQRWRDSVVAPYLRLLDLERLVGTNVECSPGKTLIAPMTGSDYSLM